MKYLPIDPQLFINNRKRFVETMKANSIAVFHSNDEMPRSGDQFFPFKQNGDLFALTGLDQEETILVLFPDCPKPEFREIAFLRETNEHIAVWEGHKYTKDEARTTSGIKTILWTKEYEKTIGQLMILADHVYLNSNEHDRYNSDVETRDQRMAKVMRSKYPMHNYLRAQPILKELAMIKSSIEVDLIKHACGITRDAFLKVLEVTRPGITEYEIEAEIMKIFIANRSSGPAYSSIIASGSNACVLHYTENNQVCKDGDVMLMDFGAEYANYTSDLSRSIPINGKFTERQRAVYDAVKRVLDSATQMLIPGNTLDAYEKEVGNLMQSELKMLGLLDQRDIDNQDPSNPAYKKYFMHGTSHHLGIDVHDLSNRYTPMSEGMVFTCEPGIYIPEEGLGIRLENDIWISASGPINLMADIPIEAEEIEDLMNSK